MRGLLAAIVCLGMSGCASHALWLGGHPPVLEEYPDSIVRIYRAGLDCRIEIITKTETIVTLPTRCLNIPHVDKP